ncbi:hypothetical protein [Evansella tamaricis]|uniref:Uncharacterized protein n=1 Tax=Evansella tamaricis TaxID=2069301 RepID=A0ABS6JM28_9BACI|nr:hypothetical protein [Evansella tamaricis]MBU9714588.1 hypothetical protein [Evansella tamaricis]
MGVGSGFFGAHAPLRAMRKPVAANKRTKLSRMRKATIAFIWGGEG